MLLFTLIFSLWAVADTKPAPWIEASNTVAREYALADGELFPERASAIGYSAFDGRALHMERNANAIETEFLLSWNARLGQEIAKASDPNLSLDLKILRGHLRLRLEEIRLEEKHGEISFFAGTRFVLESLLGLLNEQNGPERRAAAADRFHLYVNGESNHPPLLTAFRSRTLGDELRFQKKRLSPLRAELERYLGESPQYLKGIRETLEKTGRHDWENDFALFTQQSHEFDDFLRTEILPRSRKDFRLPKEIYAHSLKLRGIEASPEELMHSAKAEYKRLYREFRSLARKVALSLDLPSAEPAAVIAQLKKRQVLQPAEVKALFENANQTLEQIIRREHLVTLPANPLRIRVAGEAESLANPIPHLIAPPLVNNHGVRPEFVVPSFTSGHAVLDDFSYAAAALVLSAHEGRPGHDLQFSSMLDNGTSLIRSRYAFTNSNVEGWGLYAEEMVFPYLPLSAQFVALQMRLVRVARAFLDPEVQLGKIRPGEVTRFLQSELGISPRLAQLELHRFEYDNPGQAPSYFYGLARMEHAKHQVELAQGARFTDRCFHDGVLSLGMLPVGMIGNELKGLRCGKKQALK